MAIVCDKGEYVEMNWTITHCGRVTYYTKPDNPVFSDLVVETLDNGDLKLYFVGMTGAAAATRDLGLEDTATMDPEREVPRAFDVWERYVREAGICESLKDLDFIEVRAFGATPKVPNPVVDPAGYAAERRRIREAYQRAYVTYWKERMPGKGLPVRFTVYVSDLPDSPASYEFSAVALYQRSLHHP